MSYLITQSLLNSWLYLYKTDKEDEAKDSFLNTLNRVSSPPTKAMQNGIDFENAVYSYCFDNSVHLPACWEKGVKGVSRYIQGGVFQLSASTKRHIAGLDFVLYGRLDALKMGTIYDVKFSECYKCGKYIDSPQHPMYFAICPEVSRFVYVISDGEEVWTEAYTRQETPDINVTIEQFVDYLKSDKLLDTYCKKWESKYG